ncbi:hypothetical protein N0V90_006085 [Kalmusia sp. IMI 367209]|nr:hypothetical protein N0V90_006085 [Kalmusia sp. IMI 367209]
MAETSCCLGGAPSRPPPSALRCTRRTAVANSSSYIAGLIDHVQKLRARANPSPTASGFTPQEPTASTPVALVKSESVKTESVASEAQGQPVHHEHYFAVAAESYRYLGSEACLIKSPRQNAKFPSPDFDDLDDDFHLSWRQSTANFFELVEVFLDEVQPLYPVLDLSARYLAPEPPADLTDPELFILNMIYSVASHVMPLTGRKRHPGHLWNPTGRQTYHMGNCYKYRGLAKNFFAKAENHIEAATADTTIGTLRAVLLLAINNLFDPLTGNIGQQVALAARLAISLKQKAQELSPQEAAMIRNMHSTIFSLENEFATVLDRPATFPEPEWELCFDQSKPVDYLCSLYRLQNRFRKGDAAAKDLARSQLPIFDQGQLPSSLRMALHQTHLLFNPVWQTSWYMLEAVVSTGSIHISTTPHWVYRAATVLLKDMKGINPADVVQLYSNALLVLETSAWKWGSAAALSASLSSLMRQMKSSVAEPHWEGPKILYDVFVAVSLRATTSTPFSRPAAYLVTLGVGRLARVEGLCVLELLKRIEVQD